MLVICTVLFQIHRKYTCILAMMPNLQRRLGLVFHVKCCNICKQLILLIIQVSTNCNLWMISLFQRKQRSLVGCKLHQWELLPSFANLYVSGTKVMTSLMTSSFLPSLLLSNISAIPVMTSRWQVRNRTMYCRFLLHFLSIFQKRLEGKRRCRECKWFASFATFSVPSNGDSFFLFSVASKGKNCCWWHVGKHHGVKLGDLGKIDWAQKCEFHFQQ